MPTRMHSVYVIPCRCGVMVESPTPATTHACAQLNTVENPDGPASAWPKRVRELEVLNWGKEVVTVGGKLS